MDRALPSWLMALTAVIATMNLFVFGLFSLVHPELPWPAEAAVAPAPIRFFAIRMGRLLVAWPPADQLERIGIDGVRDPIIRLDRRNGAIADICHKSANIVRHRGWIDFSAMPDIIGREVCIPCRVRRASPSACRGRHPPSSHGPGRHRW